MKRLLTLVLLCGSIGAFAQDFPSLKDKIRDCSNPSCETAWEAVFDILQYHETRLAMIDAAVMADPMQPCIDIENCDGNDLTPTGGNLFVDWDIGTIVEYRWIIVGHLVNIVFYFDDVTIINTTQTLTLNMLPAASASLVNTSGFWTLGGNEVVMRCANNKGTNLLILHKLGGGNWTPSTNNTLQGSFTFEVN